MGEFITEVLVLGLLYGTGSLIIGLCGGNAYSSDKNRETLAILVGGAFWFVVVGLLFLILWWIL